MPENQTLTLEQVREQARQKLKGICGVYRTCDGQDIRLCQGHSYGSPIGIGGAGTGASFANNFKALDALHLNARLIGPDFEPDTAFDFFGAPLDFPVMGASVSGVNSFGGEAVITEQLFCTSIVQGCKAAGSLGWRGDSFNYSLENAWGIDAIAQASGWGVQIVKPHANDIIIDYFKKAEEAGAIAVGVDVDGFGSNAMSRNNRKLFRKSADDLHLLVSSTKLPVIFKGIMNARDAVHCADAGAAAIVVSNHGGRVMDYSPGTADVLPSIVMAVGNRTMVLADGGVRTGYDVLKMLALGAKAVLVGRDLVRAAVGAQAEGVRIHMTHLHNELKKAMKMTGCANLNEISEEIIYRGL